MHKTTFSLSSLPILVLVFFASSVYAQDWAQLGFTINGSGSGDRFGTAVVISSDGNTIAVSAPQHKPAGTVPGGQISIYIWDGTQWSLQGASIVGLGINLYGEKSLSLSADGSTVAFSQFSKAVDVYVWDGTAWVQQGASLSSVGQTVSLSADGNRLAIGDDNGSGVTRIYEWSASTWTQLGANISGETSGDEAGHSVSLSPDGSRVAIGSINNGGNGTDAGHVRIYEWDAMTTSWLQLGSDIDGEAAGDLSGHSVSLSTDGQIVAIGAPENVGSGSSPSGHVRIYEWNGSAWTQRGTDIDGISDDESGYSVSLSGDGATVAIGAIDMGPDDGGGLRVWKWNGSSWGQHGTNIGESAEFGDVFGSSVSLTSDGSRLISGAPNDGNSPSGYIEVYYFDDIPPSMSITTTTSTPFSTLSFPVTFTLSEEVTDFVSDDVNIINGIMSDFAGSGSTYTATISPILDGLVEVNVSASSFTDAVGLANTAATSLQLDYQDIIPPTLVIASTTSSPFKDASFPVSFTLSEATTDFINTDITVTNGTLSNFAGSGTDYTATIIPVTEGDVTIEILASSFTDAGANGNTAATPLTLTFDPIQPTITIETATVSPFNNATFLVNFILSESTANFDQTDIATTNGVVNNFTGSGMSYSAEITPVSDGEVTVSVDEMKFEDAAGNQNTASNTLSLTYDSTEPSVLIASNATAYNSPAFTITITISENAIGFAEEDINVSNGTISDFTGSGTDFSATITSGSIGTVAVDIASGAFTDLAGNGNTVATTLAIEYIEFEGWTQQGADLDGLAERDEFGWSISISDDGNTMAVGAPKNDAIEANSGKVQVFQWNGSNWMQQGADINGDMVGSGSFTASGDQTGLQISLSGDGSTLAVAGGFNEDDFLFEIDGRVRIYEWDGMAWIQQGADIVAEGGGDQMGESMSISTDGNTVAIGALLNDGNGTNAGHVRVFSWNGTSWVQQGADLDGASSFSFFGRAVSISGDASTLAVSSTSTNGTVTVYHWNGTSWIQQGLEIVGEAAGDEFGFNDISTNLSTTGDTLAIGAFGNDEGGSSAGHARIFTWSGSAWVQLGTDIDGKAAGDFAGWSLDLSNDGSLVAVGSLGNDENGNSAGQTRLFRLINGGWVQVGNDINGEAAGDQFGTTVSLSGDGSTVAIGGYTNDGSFINAGHVQVYSLDSTKPSVTISSTENSPTGSSSFPISFTLSEASTDFGSDDIDVTNGTLSGFSGSESAYSGNVTANTEGIITIEIAANTFTDLAGLQNEAATPFTITSQRNTWTGLTDSDWSIATNWSAGVVPGAGSDVVIPNVSNNPEINTDVELNDMEIASGGLLTISSNSLKINGNAVLDGSLIIPSGSSFLPIGLVSGSGSATVHRNTTFSSTTGRYSTIGSPISDGNTGSLGSIVYSYDESVAYDPGGADGSTRFVEVTSPESMTAGDAYFSAKTGDISFTGMPNHGNIGVSLVYNEANDGGATSAGFNLVSNPYTAAISYASFIAVNGDIDGAVYVWDDGGSDVSSRSNSDYIVVTSMAVTGGSGRVSDIDGFIRSSQGFFVKATSAGTLNFTPTMMDTGNNGDDGFFRKTTPVVFKLVLSNDKSTSDIAIGFTEEATTSFDRTLDAYKLKGNSNLQLYSKMGESNMAIQALPFISDETSIGLGVDIEDPGMYSFEIPDASSFDFKIYLLDKELNQLIDLSDGDYSFNSSSVSSSDRFSLIISPSAILSIDTIEQNEVVVYAKDNQLYVRLDEELKDATVSIYNINGRLIKQEQHIDFNTSEWSTSLDKNGLFILTIHASNKSITKKFLK